MFSFFFQNYDLKQGFQTYYQNASFVENFKNYNTSLKDYLKNYHLNYLRPFLCSQTSTKGHLLKVSKLPLTRLKTFSFFFFIINSRTSRLSFKLWSQIPLLPLYCSCLPSLASLFLMAFSNSVMAPKGTTWLNFRKPVLNLYQN